MARSPYRLEFHPEAVLEARRARLWYESCSLQAAHDFVEQLAEAERQATRHPLRWPTYLHGTRRYSFETFPYALVYLVREETVFAIAVIHLHRKPGYWSGRLGF